MAVIFFKIIGKIRLHIAPKNIDIVLLDDLHTHHISSVLNNYSCVYFRHGYVDLYLSIMTPVYFFYFLWHSKRIDESVFLASVKSINPRLCLTFIDNARAAVLTSTYLQPVRTILIQNGQRTCISIAAPDLMGKTIDVYFSFGCVDKEEYEKSRINIVKSIPCGSFKNSIYHRNWRNTTSCKKPYIVYVSQFRASRVKERHFTVDGYRRIVSNCIKVSSVLGVDLYIMLVNQKGGNSYSDEVSWYKQFGNNITLIDNNVDELKSYDVLENSELAIGFTSTLLRECFGRNKKTLFVNYTKDREFDFPMDGVWRLINPSDDEFITSATSLYRMPIESYIELLKNKSRYVMENPKNINVIDLLEEAIRSYVDNDGSFDSRNFDCYEKK